ncbi:MAG: amidohydrolase family protein [Acidobacteriota bacterium]
MKGGTDVQKLNPILRMAILLAFASLNGSAMTEAASPKWTRIDAHVHVFHSNPRLFELLRQLNLKVVNICVVDKHDKGFEEAAPQHAQALEVFRASHGGAPWCATFDPQNFEAEGFADRTIDLLKHSFSDGAVAVKVYKSIGMELKTKAGRYLMIDDPLFEPIFRFIEKQNKTLYAHIAEPSAAWKPLDPASPHYSYYKENPDWHVYRLSGFPAKETILEARDRVLKRHPKLRVVGCHLGSMEDDVDQIAWRLDQFPNFAVDTAARVKDLMLQPRNKVRAFLIKYQDRILYATDLGLLQNESVPRRLQYWEETYARDWKYFATGERFEDEGRTFEGLELPEKVLIKIFRENALKWVPGIQ